jgi:hypothetical protein
LQDAVDALNRAIAINSRASSYYYVLRASTGVWGGWTKARKALETFKRLDHESAELDNAGAARARPAPLPLRRDSSVSSREPRASRRGSSSWPGDARRRRSRRGSRSRRLVRTRARRCSSRTSRRPAGLLQAKNVSGSAADKQFLLEEMGCGAAFFDYDRDGWLDIFLVNATSLDPSVRAGGPTSYLFHNNRDGTFTDVTKKAGLTHSGWGQGCCVGDYDNDGFDDLSCRAGAGTCSTTTTVTGRSPTSRQRPASPEPAPAGARAVVSSTTIATAVSISSSPTT